MLLQNVNNDLYTKHVQGRSHLKNKLYSMLIMRNILSTVWLRFWWWRLFKIWRLRFGQDFKVEVWSRCWGWILIEILWLKIGQHFKPDGRSRFGGLSLVKILKLNFDQLVMWLESSYFGEKTQPLAFVNVSTVVHYDSPPTISWIIKKL